MTRSDEHLQEVLPPIMKPANQPYLMSFVTGGVHLNESINLASFRCAGESWDEVAAHTNVFAFRKEASAKRLVRELTYRLRRLDDNDLELFCAGDRVQQKALMWLAICRTYRFIGEWASLVLWDHAQSYQCHIGYADFDRFWREKAEQVPDLAALTASTRTKLRAVLFRLMRETGVTDADGRLNGALPPVRIADRLADSERLYFPGRRQ